MKIVNIIIFIILTIFWIYFIIQSIIHRKLIAEINKKMFEDIQKDLLEIEKYFDYLANKFLNLARKIFRK